MKVRCPHDLTPWIDRQQHHRSMCARPLRACTGTHRSHRPARHGVRDERTGPEAGGVHRCPGRLVERGHLDLPEVRHADVSDSELSHARIEKIDDAGLKEGDEMKVKIVKFDDKKQKFVLSRKALIPREDK